MAWRYCCVKFAVGTAQRGDIRRHLGAVFIGIMGPFTWLKLAQGSSPPAALQLQGGAGRWCRGPHVFGPLVCSLGLPAPPAALLGGCWEVLARRVVGPTSIFGPLVCSLGLPALPGSAPPWHLCLVLLGLGWHISWHCSRSGGLPSAGLLCPSFTPDADKHRAPGLLSQLPGPANRQQRKRLTPALLVAWGDLPCAACHVGAGAPDPFVASASGRVGAPASSSSSVCSDSADAAALLAAAVGEASNPGPPFPWHTAGRREAAHGSRRFGPAMTGNVLPLPASAPLTAFSALSQDARPACLAAAAGPPIPL